MRSRGSCRSSIDGRATAVRPFTFATNSPAGSRYGSVDALRRRSELRGRSASASTRITPDAAVTLLQTGKIVTAARVTTRSWSTCTRDRNNPSEAGRSSRSTACRRRALAHRRDHAPGREIAESSATSTPARAGSAGCRADRRSSGRCSRGRFRTCADVADSIRHCTPRLGGRITEIDAGARSEAPAASALPPASSRRKRNRVRIFTVREHRPLACSASRRTVPCSPSPVRTIRSMCIDPPGRRSQRSRARARRRCSMPVARVVESLLEIETGYRFVCV